MEQTRYVGMDVHKECIAIVVLNVQGKVVLEAVIETKTQTVLDFIKGIRGMVHVTFEEGMQAAWLYEVLRPHVAEVIVCDPRKNKLLSEGNKGDQVDARKLAQLLRAGLVTPVYHGEHGTRTLQELARSYECLVSDCTRGMNRLKALYRARAIPWAGESVYKVAGREEWLGKLTEPGARHRAEHLQQALDELGRLRDEARTAMVAESRKHSARRLLLGISTLGPVRVAQLIATIDTPHRFRTKRQLWAQSGLAVVTHSSAAYRVVQGEIRRAARPGGTRGLNPNSQRPLKEVFTGAALTASVQGAFKPYYDNLVAHGLRPALARLTVARKIAAVTLAVWKKGEPFAPQQVVKHAA